MSDDMSTDPLAGAERIELRHGLVALLVLRPPMPERPAQPRDAVAALTDSDEEPREVIATEEAARPATDWSASELPPGVLPW